MSLYSQNIMFKDLPIRTRCTTLCDKVSQWLETGRWFSPGTPVSSTNKADRHDITEILLKVALNTIKLTKNQTIKIYLVGSEPPHLALEVREHFLSSTFPSRAQFLQILHSLNDLNLLKKPFGQTTHLLHSIAPCTGCISTSRSWRRIIL
jgi:hypothetical protein